MQAFASRLRLRVGRRPLALALALAALAAAPALAQGTDTLVIARSMDVNALDPARAYCDTCQIYLTSVYDTMVTLGPDNRTVEPRLAKSWEASADQSVFTFRLDPAARFADGSPVEAKDVKWTWERLGNIKGSPSYLMDGVASIETPDPATVVVTLAAPNAEFVNKLSAGFAAIINSDLAIAEGATADAEADKTDQAEAWFLSHSAGSGPFKLAAYRPGEELRLTRNDAYWGEKPYFSEVVFRQTQDAVAQAQILQSGEADVAMQIDIDTAGALAGSGVTTEIVPSYNFLYIALSAGADSNAVPLTPDLRKAIALAIDYDAMIDFTVAGEGRKQSTAIPNGFPGSDGLPERARDLAEARALLAKAGVPDGFPIEAVYPNDNI